MWSAPGRFCNGSDWLAKGLLLEGSSFAILGAVLCVAAHFLFPVGEEGRLNAILMLLQQAAAQQRKVLDLDAIAARLLQVGAHGTFRTDSVLAHSLESKDTEAGNLSEARKHVLEFGGLGFCERLLCLGHKGYRDVRRFSDGSYSKTRRS